MTSDTRQYTGRVIGINDVSSDTRTFTVEIDNKQRLPFSAGQYLHLTLPGFGDRPFSVASPPHEPLLEFHVKSQGLGLSAHIVEHLKPGSPVTLKGPFGQAHWRQDGRPLLALAGGIGVAPLKSIIGAALHDRAHFPVYLYWGTRLGHQLYLDDFFRALNRRHPRFSYIPVLSEEKDHPHYRAGLPGAAVAEDFESLFGMSIYLAGPRAMADEILPLLLQKGAEEDYIFSDNFTL